MPGNRNHQRRYIFIALPFLWLLSAQAAAIAMRWTWTRLEACPAIEHVGQFVTDSKIRIHAWTLHKPPQG